jgi:hypothetical protein
MAECPERLRIVSNQDFCAGNHCPGHSVGLRLFPNSLPPIDLTRMEMADQPKMTGVYDAPNSTSTVNAHAGSGAKSTMDAGKSTGIPSWVWIVAVVVVLAVLGMMIL